MKYFSALMLLFVLVSCKQQENHFATDTLKSTEQKKDSSTPTKEKSVVTSKQPTNSTNSKKDITPFLNNFDHFKKNEQTSIAQFEKLAIAAADEKIALTAENIEMSIANAKNYSHAYILLGSYTIIEITDFKNCEFSKSWNICAPKGRSYTKKGNLVYDADYINNLMGVPDKRSRVLYLFK
jgi:hypothetical protein